VNGLKFGFLAIFSGLGIVLVGVQLGALDGVLPPPNHAAPD
jgi:hypothetical protein